MSIQKTKEEIKLDKQKELYMYVKSIPTSDDPDEYNYQIETMASINRLLMELGVIPARLMMQFQLDQKLAVTDTIL